MKDKATRDGFGEALIELGKNTPDTVVLSADLTNSTRAEWFKTRHPERFFAFGVSEQDMISAAAGFALSGKVPFCCTFSVFASGRVWDQLRVSLCLTNANVKVGASHGGITVGEDGATHQALEDIAITRVLPHMTVLVPSCAVSAKKATCAAYAWKGPVYIRVGRASQPVIMAEDEEFQIGKARVLREGKDVTIIACGIMVQEALKAHDELKRKGIAATIVDLHTIKPLDEATILNCAKNTGAIVTAEEHSVLGGMGSAVCELLSRKHPVPVRMVGVEGTFGESGTPKELLKHFGLTSENIVKNAEALIALK